MAMPVVISGDNEVKARVTPSGQLVVAPLNYDLTKFNELAEPDTAYNFYMPKQGKQFVITGFFARADKQVSATVDATVIVYEATSVSSTTVDRILFQLAMVQGDIFPMGSLNIIVNKGVYVNGKTDDDDIHMNVMGYYIDDIGEVFE